MDANNHPKMSFTNRVKKEMTEGIVRAILEDAGYRVIDTGIEKVIRELCCLSRTEYTDLAYPQTMSCLPDFVVMDREQKEKHLIEVKYRADWGKSVIDEVREQVRIFREIMLICVHANAPDPKSINGPSRYLRCCKLRYEDGKYQIRSRRKGKLADWKDVDGLEDNESLWWAFMSPLQNHFDNLEKDSSSTYARLTAAIKALGGILDN